MINYTIDIKTMITMLRIDVLVIKIYSHKTWSEQARIILFKM